LPLVHALGIVISGALVLGAAVDHRREARASGVVLLAAASACGILGVLVGWNHLYEGDWLRGGYAPYTGESVHLPGLPRGLVLETGTFLAGAPLLLGLGLWVLALRRGGPCQGIALVLTLLLLVFNAPFVRLEATRRLACTLPAWAAVLGMGWDPLEVPKVVTKGLLGLSLVPGVWGFAREEGGFVSIAGTLYYFPYILWVRLASQGRILLAVLPPAVLLLIAGLAWVRLLGLVGADQRAP
jgi:hypothetical protein